MRSTKFTPPPANSTLWIPSAFVLAALGPYLGNSGLKTEHVVIYGTACIYTFVLLPHFHFRAWSNFSSVMYLWLCVGISQLVGWGLFTSSVRTPPPTARILAAVEHQIQPLVIVGMLCAWAGRNISGEQLSAALRRALQVLVWGLCLNSLLILWFLKTGVPGMFLHWLPPSGTEADSVYVLSVQMGRFGGIFNQPFEAGLSYSLALLAWCRLQGERKRTTFREYALLLLLLFGGFASVSKVFIFGGIPLCIVFCFLYKPCRKPILNLKTGVVLAGFVLFASLRNLQELWDGFSLLIKYFSPEKGTDLVDLYTARRFGQGTTQVTDYFSEAWKASPIFGFGFAPYDVLDSGFLWAFASGGTLGLSLFIFMLCTALSRARKLMRQSREEILPFMMLLLMVAAASGAPSFTINRASTIFWTLYPLATLAGLGQMSAEKLRPTYKPALA